jgi:hypothetical protein
VLFIGNSLTQSNDLPRRVQELALDAGAPIGVDAVVAPGFSLEDHLASGPAVARIRSRAWTAVVLQQGPSTLPDSRTALIRDATRLVGEIRAVGARPALLEVWPLPGQRQEDVTASYRAAAQATGAVLIPAGQAWQAAAARTGGRLPPERARDLPGRADGPLHAQRTPPSPTRAGPRAAAGREFVVDGSGRSAESRSLYGRTLNRGRTTPPRP